MFPLALEKQYSALFVREFRASVEGYNREVLSALKREIKSDSLDVQMRADSFTDLMIFISRLREKGDFINASELHRKIKGQFSQIDAWARDKTEASIEKLFKSMQPKTDGKRYLPTVNISKGLDSNLIDEYTKTNVGLIEKLSQSHRDDVEKIIKKGFSEGFSTNAIAGAIRDRIGVNTSKARFWANDQAGKFFGHATRLRQKRAGIPGYVWRTLEDGRVRDSHGILHGKFFNWDAPPSVGGHHLHPGEDYRCRCFAEPALSEADGDANRINKMRHKHIEKRIEVDNDIKKDVSKAVDIYKSVLNIDSSEIKQKLKVLKMKPDDPDLGLSSGYYDPKTQEIFLDPGKSFGITTVIHEMAHWLDHTVLGKGMLASKTKAFRKFRKAVKKSMAFKEMQNIKKSKITVDSGELICFIYIKDKTKAVSVAWLDYIMADEEIFARSMEQYLSILSANKELRKQLKTKKEEFVKRKGFNHYWTDEDFMAIKESLDSIFKKQGWIK